MEELLFNFYAEGTQRQDIAPGRSCFCLDSAAFEHFFEPPELRPLNRLSTVLIGLVRQAGMSPFSLDERTALYMIGDDADPVIPADARSAPADEQQLVRLLRKISPLKEVGIQASMCASRLGAELGARGKIWTINPSRYSISLLLDDYRLSVQEGSANRAVICTGVTMSSVSECWAPGPDVREVARIVCFEGWSKGLELRIGEILYGDLSRSGGEFG